MYKFFNQENNKVSHIIRLVYGISPGTKEWDMYQDWLSSGGVTIPFLTDEEELKLKEYEIRKKYAAMLLDVTKPYDKEERETWKTQEEEALQFSSNHDEACTMIRNMASNRGISAELMAEKILSNAALFREASGKILGAQQAELDALYPENIDDV